MDAAAPGQAKAAAPALGPRQSKREQLREMFEMFDDDGSGEIELEEMYEQLTKLGAASGMNTRGNRERLRKQFNYMDKDRSGTVEFHEFEAATIAAANADFASLKDEQAAAQFGCDLYIILAVFRRQQLLKRAYDEALSPRSQFQELQKLVRVDMFPVEMGFANRADFRDVDEDERKDKDRQLRQARRERLRPMNAEVRSQLAAQAQRRLRRTRQSKNSNQQRRFDTQMRTTRVRVPPLSRAAHRAVRREERALARARHERRLRSAGSSSSSRPAGSRAAGRPAGSLYVTPPSSASSSSVSVSRFSRPTTTHSHRSRSRPTTTQSTPSLAEDESYDFFDDECDSEEEEKRTWSPAKRLLARPLSNDQLPLAETRLKDARRRRELNIVEISRGPQANAFYKRRRQQMRRQGASQLAALHI